MVFKADINFDGLLNLWNGKLFFPIIFIIFSSYFQIKPALKLLLSKMKNTKSINLTFGMMFMAMK